MSGNGNDPEGTLVGSNEPPTPAPELEQWTREHCGTDLRVTYSGGAEASSRVWAVAGATGQWFLKQYPQRRKLDQEVRAYREWLPQLNTTTPQLIAHRETPPYATLLSTLPGRPAAGLELSIDQECWLQEQAGRAARQLHDIPAQDRDPLPLAVALPKRFEAIASKLRDTVPGIELARAFLAQPQLFATSRRVPCHRDYQPQNWLWSAGNRGTANSWSWSLIDFEHAHLDHWLSDVVKLWCTTWWQRPDLSRSFFAGYGREPTAAEQLELRAIAAVHTLGTIAWGHEHADEAVLANGHEAWLRVRAELASAPDSGSA